jgi:uncharacterized membrane protein|tara:strand:+ start:113471 stop:113869 length:399 start_codon:yes stop_codon:yes gene_type:complete
MTDPLSDRPQGASGPSGPSTGDLTQNKPLITAIVMLCGIFTGGLTTLAGGILAYLLQADAVPGSWEETHYRYHIRTFWGSVIGVAVATVLLLLLIGFFLFPILAMWLIVRSVIALLKAKENRPMPNPTTWLF